MMDAIVIDSVSKLYKSKKALDSISFAVPKGSFTVLLGPNGSGKSTLLKILTGLLRPDSGAASINGFDVAEDRVSALSGAGCLVETPEPYRDVSGRMFLEYVCSLHGMSKAESAAEAERVLKIVGMSGRAEGKIRGYSKGMKQRICLGQALVGSPSILILDEPVSGLDPRGSDELFSMLKGLNKCGTTILMSSHQLHESESLCDRAVMISGGSIVAQGDMKDLVVRATVVVSVIGDVGDDVLEEIRCLGGVVSAEASGSELRIITEGGQETQADIVSALEASGARVCSVSREDALKDVFLKLTGGGERWPPFL